jgi:hypothetical protein
MPISATGFLEIRRFSCISCVSIRSSSRSNSTQPIWIPTNEVESAVGLVLTSWTRSQPKEASAWLEASKSATAIPIRDVFLAWPENASISTEEWLDLISQPEVRKEMGMFLEGWPENH